MPRKFTATPHRRAAILAGGHGHAFHGRRGRVDQSQGQRAAHLARARTRTRRRTGRRHGRARHGQAVVDPLPPGTPRARRPRDIAALAGAVIARGTDQPQPLDALVASAAALTSARVCHALRLALSERLPSCAVAAGEDGLALALAAAAAGGDLS